MLILPLAIVHLCGNVTCYNSMNMGSYYGGNETTEIYSLLVLEALKSKISSK